MGIFDWDNYKNGPSSDSLGGLAVLNPAAWGPALWNAATGEAGWSGAIKGSAALAAAAGGAGLAMGGAAGGAAATAGGAATTGSAAAGGSGAGWGTTALLGGSGLLNFLGQQQANQQNAQQSREQMQFQERMSSTAHQREVADLKAAGLNPILSAGGGGSSTPTGAQAVMQNSMASASDTARDIFNAKMQAQNMAMQAQQNAAQRALIGAQIANQNADTVKKAAETKALGADAVKGDIYERVYRGLNKLWNEKGSSTVNQIQRLTNDPDIGKKNWENIKNESSKYDWKGKRLP